MMLTCVVLNRTKYPEVLK